MLIGRPSDIDAIRVIAAGVDRQRNDSAALRCIERHAEQVHTDHDPPVRVCK